MNICVWQTWFVVACHVVPGTNSSEKTSYVSFPQCECGEWPVYRMRGINRQILTVLGYGFRSEIIQLFSR